MGLLAAYTAFSVGQAWTPRERSSLPTTAYLTLTLLLPTVWPTRWGGLSLCPSQEGLWRWMGGLGFAGLAFPMWAMTQWPFRWTEAAFLVAMAGMGAGAWGFLAAWRRGAFIGLLAAGVMGLPLWASPFAGLRWAFPLSPLVADASTFGRVGSVLVYGLIALMGWTLLHRRPGISNA